MDMGYGHQRASFPLKKLAHRSIINANTYKGIPKKDREVWKSIREVYEFMSRFKRIPVIGEKAFELYDKFQDIKKFYPRRDLTRINIQLWQTVQMIKRKEWGKDLIKKLAKNPLPIISTFFVPAYMAEHFKYPGDIYQIICDADISRTWAPYKPHLSKIKYLAPNYRVVERLKLYGVKKEHIFLTGFPLPIENLGTTKLTTLKKDLTERIFNLDPNKKFIGRYQKTLKDELDIRNLKYKPKRRLTLCFAVGGAGAQREIGIDIVKSLKDWVTKKKIDIFLVAGIHNSVGTYFKNEVRKLGLSSELGRGVKIIFANTKDEYFKRFNRMLRNIDILWTKPSELCFYSGLGIPIIMSAPIGSQEKFNRKWLETIGAGIRQEDVRYTAEWLNDWINSGWLAEASLQGYMEVPKYGTFNIEKVISQKFKEMKEPELVLQY